jgi:hypothetical protein
MAICPACDAELPDDDYADMDVGDEVDCPECGELIEIISHSPLEFDTSEDEEDEGPGEDDDLGDLGEEEEDDEEEFER